MRMRMKMKARRRIEAVKTRLESPRTTEDLS
jgi:hypothetical protein